MLVQHEGKLYNYKLFDEYQIEFDKLLLTCVSISAAALGKSGEIQYFFSKKL